MANHRRDQAAPGDSPPSRAASMYLSTPAMPAVAADLLSYGIPEPFAVAIVIFVGEGWASL